MIEGKRLREHLDALDKYLQADIEIELKITWINVCLGAILVSVTGAGVVSAMYLMGMVAL